MGRTLRWGLERSFFLAPLSLLLLPLELLRLLLAALLLQLPLRLLLLQLTSCLLLLLLLLLPLLLEGAKTGRPRRPSRDKRSRGLLVHRTGTPRPAGQVVRLDGNGIPPTPDRGGTGAPSCPWVWGASTCFSDDGAGSPAGG